REPISILFPYTTLFRSSRVLEAFQINEHTTISEVDNILSDAARIFNNVFGYQSKSIIAPNYTWNKKNEKKMADLGIKYIQGNIRSEEHTSELQSRENLV